MIYTVTHYGLEQSFSSIWGAMRYCRQLWRKNVPSVIWTVDRPIFASDSFKRKKSKAW
jgi:hypothetical protein